MQAHFPNVTAILDEHLISKGYINIDIANKILIDFCKCLDNFKINYRVIFGTLLGLYRDKSIIPYDHDIDIALKFSDVDSLVTCLPELLAQGFTIIRYQSGVIMSFVKNGVYIDIYLFKNTTNTEYICSSYKLTDIDFYCNNTISYIGYNFKTINNPEQFFITYYGHDWKTPIKNLRADPNNSKRI